MKTDARKLSPHEQRENALLPCACVSRATPIKPFRFLARLIRDAQGRKVFLILDNLCVYHSKKVSVWVAERKEQIELFFLPAYAPELNPDEYLNGDLKQQVRTGRPARNQQELEGRVRSAMKRLQLRPRRISAYFRHPCIAYAA